MYDAAHPDTEKQTEKLQWDQSETVAVYGLDTGAPTFVIASGPRLTVSGSISTTAAPPNQSLDCSGTLSARPGARLSSLFSVLPGPGRREVNAGANFIPTGDYIRSTGSGACRADPGGGVGLSVGAEPTKVLDAMTAAETPIGTYKLASPPETQTFTSGGPQSTPTRTSSFYARFTVGPTCPANAGAAADAAASAAPESCTGCPNPADDPLLREADNRAADIESNTYEDPEQRAIRALLKFGGRVRLEFPLKTPRQRAERKRLMNEAKRKFDSVVEKAYNETEIALGKAESQDVARARCPDVKQKIREVYQRRLKDLAEEKQTDLAFAASKVVGVINLGCGCGGSADVPRDFNSARRATA